MRSNILNVNPLIAVYDDMFGPEVLDAARALGEDRLEQPTYATEDGRIVGEKRTNMAAVIDQWSDPVLTELMTKISSIVRMPPEHCETAKLLRYEGEQLFDIHYDSYEEHGPTRGDFLKGGQRLFTSLCYLNDVEDEGQTAFPNLKIAVRPKLGRVLLFQNTRHGKNETHPDSAHVGFGPGKGVKWVMSAWWREQFFHVPREFPPAEGDFLLY